MARALGRSILSSTLACLVVLMSATTAPTIAAPAPTRTYIVVLSDGITSPEQVAVQHGKAFGFAPEIIYRHALKAYAARLSEASASVIRGRPDVLMVVPGDTAITVAGKPIPPPSPQPGQAVPTGVSRVGALESKTADIDGRDDRRVDADIAILDTGITTLHPDLNVSGGVACASSKSWEDDNGHGTHVAGTAAAVDNAIGVVGVAPGARLWSVKMLGSGGNGTVKSALCGIDWVTANADIIDVANLSWGFKGQDDGNCGLTNQDVVHQAICNSVAAGVTYIAAAGNDGAEIAQVPAAYDEVITVSALADYDGQNGGLAVAPAECINSGPDDGFTIFSNFGADVDLAAPGACIRSTWPYRIYAIASGTSMSAPHAAGAAALYVANHPSASPFDVRQALLEAADPGPAPGDPDAFPEPVLNVSNL